MENNAPASIMGGVIWVAKVVVRNSRNGSKRDVFLNGIQVGTAEVLQRPMGASPYTYIFHRTGAKTCVNFPTMKRLKEFVAGLSR